MLSLWNDARPRRHVVFGIHVPKTAGSTLLKMCRQRFGPELFQNTSQIENFKRGLAADVFSIRDPSAIRVVLGHHVYETTLQFFAPHVDAFTTLAFLREPIARLRSQFDFDCRLAAHLALAMPDEDEFLTRNANMVSRYLVEHFPRTAGDTSAPLGVRATRVLSSFDYVLPHAEVRTGFQITNKALGRWPGYLGRTPRVNAGTQIGKLRTSDAALARLNAEDVALYQAFEASRPSGRTVANPFASENAQAELERLAREPFDAAQHIQHIGEALAWELVRSAGHDAVLRRYADLDGLERDCLGSGLQRIQALSA